MPRRHTASPRPVCTPCLPVALPLLSQPPSALDMWCTAVQGSTSAAVRATRPQRSTGEAHRSLHRVGRRTYYYYYYYYYLRYYYYCYYYYYY